MRRGPPQDDLSAALDAREPEARADHAELGDVGVGVLRSVDLGGRADDPQVHVAVLGEVIAGITGAVDALLVEASPGSLASILAIRVGADDVDRHDSGREVEPRGAVVADVATIEHGRPRTGRTLEGTAHVAVGHVVHDHDATGLERAAHAVGDASQELRVGHVREGVAEQDDCVGLVGELGHELHVGQVAHVELDPRVTIELPLRLGHTGRAQVHTYDALHTGLEQELDVSAGAEARQEDHAGDAAESLGDDTQSRLGLVGRESAVVVHVRVQLGHHVVVSGDVELGGASTVEDVFGLNSHRDTSIPLRATSALDCRMLESKRSPETRGMCLAKKVRNELNRPAGFYPCGPTGLLVAGLVVVHEDAGHLDRVGGAVNAERAGPEGQHVSAHLRLLSHAGAEEERSQTGARALHDLQLAIAVDVHHLVNGRLDDVLRDHGVRHLEALLDGLLPAGTGELGADVERTAAPGHVLAIPRAELGQREGAAEHGVLVISAQGVDVAVPRVQHTGGGDAPVEDSERTGTVALQPVADGLVPQRSHETLGLQEEVVGVHERATVVLDQVLEPLQVSHGDVVEVAEAEQHAAVRHGELGQVVQAVDEVAPAAGLDPTQEVRRPHVAHVLRGLLGKGPAGLDVLVDGFERGIEDDARVDSALAELRDEHALVPEVLGPLAGGHDHVGTTIEELDEAVDHLRVHVEADLHGVHHAVSRGAGLELGDDRGEARGAVRVRLHDDVGADEQHRLVGLHAGDVLGPLVVKHGRELTAGVQIRAVDSTHGVEEREERVGQVLELMLQSHRKDEGSQHGVPAHLVEALVADAGVVLPSHLLGELRPGGLSDGHPEQRGLVGVLVEERQGLDLKVLEGGRDLPDGRVVLVLHDGALAAPLALASHADQRLPAEAEESEALLQVVEQARVLGVGTGVLPDLRDLHDLSVLPVLDEDLAGDPLVRVLVRSEGLVQEVGDVVLAPVLGLATREAVLLADSLDLRGHTGRSGGSRNHGRSREVGACEQVGTTGAGRIELGHVSSSGNVGVRRGLTRGCVTNKSPPQGRKCKVAPGAIPRKSFLYMFRSETLHKINFLFIAYIPAKNPPVGAGSEVKIDASIYIVLKNPPRVMTRRIQVQYVNRWWIN